MRDFRSALRDPAARAQLLKEIRIDAFRASGPGGQHVNKTSSAIRLTHLPTGVTAVAQDSPSQWRNREIALSRLVEKLEQHFHIPKSRVPTRPSRAAKLERLREKKARSRIKTARSKKGEFD